MRKPRKLLKRTIEYIRDVWFFMVGALILIVYILLFYHISIQSGEQQENVVNTVSEADYMEYYIRSLQEANKRLEAELNELKKEVRSNTVQISVLQDSDAIVEWTPIADNFQVTWYNYNSGYTFSGVPPVEGITVAVDPSVIPLGSWVYVEGVGIRKAQDTGRLVKGNIVDVYKKDKTEKLKQLGRTHNVKVYLLTEGTEDKIDK